MRPRLHALTVLRFVASMHIVLHHYGASAFERAPRFLESARLRAHIGLSIFFIMSGFVLSYAYVEPLSTGAVRRSDFFRARFARVFPLYFATWLAETSVRIVHGSGMPYGDYTVGSVAHLFALQAWAPSLGFTANIPAWTVSAEVAFYVLFPFVVPYFASAKRPRILIAIAALVLIGALPHVVDAVFRVDALLTGSTPFLFTWARQRWPPFRLAEFLLGVSLGRLFADDIARGVRRSGVALSLAACLGIAPLMLLDARFLPPSPVCWALYIPLSALLIYGLAHVRNPTRSWIRGPLVGLGDASYAIYILQTPVLFVLSSTLLPEWQQRRWFLAEYLVLLLTIALLAHRYLERPANELLRGRERAQPEPALAGSIDA